MGSSFGDYLFVCAKKSSMSLSRLAPRTKVLQKATVGLPISRRSLATEDA